MKRIRRGADGGTYESLLKRLRRSLEDLSPQLQAAAGFLIDRPEEVALLSMREQAKIAGVQPVTMTRLAQTLGFSGFDELKGLFADSIREKERSFSSRSVNLLAKQKAVGDAGLISTYIDDVIRHLERLKEDIPLFALIESANHLQAATRIYALGLRSVFPVVFQFSYVQSYFSDRVVLLDGSGGAGLDKIQRPPAGSALLLVSIRPYATSAIAVARKAAKQGVKIIAITDNAMSPAARIANVVNLIGTDSPSFFDTVTPAFAVSEILVALLAARFGPEITALIEHTESRLVEMGDLSQGRSNGNTRQSRTKTYL